MESLEQALAGNKAWAEPKAAEQRDFYPQLAAGQFSVVLRIVASDSRVPATQLPGLRARASV